jgi:hypothetical protein
MKKKGVSKMEEPKGINLPNMMMLIIEAREIDQKLLDAINFITHDSQLVVIFKKETSNENEK